MKERGKIVTWFHDKTYGFVKPDRPSLPDIYMKQSNFVDGLPYVGANVEFEILQNQKAGRPYAVNIKVLGA